MYLNEDCQVTCLLFEQFDGMRTSIFDLLMIKQGKLTVTNLADGQLLFSGIGNKQYVLKKNSRLYCTLYLIKLEFHDWR